MRTWGSWGQVRFRVEMPFRTTHTAAADATHRLTVWEKALSG